MKKKLRVTALTATAAAALVLTTGIAPAHAMGGGVLPNPVPVGNPWMCALFMSGAFGPLTVPKYVKYCTW